MPTPNIFRRVILNAFRGTGTIRNHPRTRPLSSPLEILEARTVPATVQAFSITGGTPNASDNDYTRINNAIQNAVDNEVILLVGNFNWAETNAKASWALGSDKLSNTDDEYSIFVPPDLNGVTITAAAPVNGVYSAQIKGLSSDLATVDGESFLFFNDSYFDDLGDPQNGVNQGWTISNLDIQNFDCAIEMYSTDSIPTAFNDTTITNNKIVIYADSSATTDSEGNLGIYLGLGTNQTISNNLIQIAGTGISDISAASNGRYAQSVGIQTQVGGGGTYDDLEITGNTIQVTGNQNARPEIVIGLWENGNAHTSDILVSGNTFTNSGASNNPSLNMQRAFRLTSQSSPTTTATYQNNTVSGAEIGFQWLPPSYGADYSGTQPVELIGNTITNTITGVLVQSDGAAYLAKNTITGNGTGVQVGGIGAGGIGISDGRLLTPSGGTAAVEFNIITGNTTGISAMGVGTIDPMNNNNLSGNSSKALVNNTGTTIDATGNWWGSANAGVVAAQHTGPVNDGGFLAATNTPAFTNATSAVFTKNGPNSFTFTTTGIPTAAITAGTLPNGVTLLDNADGTATLSGTPTGAVGSVVIIVAADNGFPLVTQSFTLSIVDPPSITSAASTTFTVGTPGTFQLTADPGVPASTTFLAPIGALPNGVTFNTTTGVLSGTPSAGTGGIYPITLRVSNGVNSVDTQSFTLNVTGAPSIVSPSSATFILGEAGTFTIQTQAFPVATITVLGLPDGLSYLDNGDGTATISGTPTGPTGTTTVSITAGNGVGTDATENLDLTVAQSPSFTSANTTGFNIGAFGSFTVTTTAGFPAATTLTRSGTLPAGVTFVDNGDGTATLSGTPNPGTGGSFVFTITASNDKTSSTQQFTLEVSGAPTIPGAATPSFNVGAFGTFTLSATGGPLPALAITSGTLPSGLSFIDNADGTATISGTPNVGTGGIYQVTVTADNNTTDANRVFTIVVNEAPTFTSPDTVTFVVGTSVGTTRLTGTAFKVLTDVGFPATTVLSISPNSLPPGVTFSLTALGTGSGDGQFGGNPTSPGVYSITFTATAGTLSTTQTFTVIVKQKPTITSVTTATVVSGQEITPIQITGIGFPAPALAITSGTLPSGLSFIDNGNGTATISGTPDLGTSGTYAVTITADNGTTEAIKVVTINVNEKPVFTSEDTTDYPVNVTISTSAGFQVTATGTPATMSYSVSGTLPPGVTGINASTGRFVGKPTQIGNYTFTVIATNAAGSTQQTFTIVVPANPVITTTLLKDWTVNKAYPGTTVVVLGGSGTRTSFGVSAGSLPPGLSFNSSTGAITGTPTAVGNYTFDITATYSGNGSGSQTYTVTINPPPALDAASLPTWTVGATGFSHQVVHTPNTGTGVLKYALVSGSLGGLALNVNTGVISGTPTTAVNNIITVKVTDGTTAFSTQTYSLVISPKIVITTTALALGTINQAYSQNVVLQNGTGTGPFTYLVSSGNLPAGLSLDNNTGEISGMPSVTGVFPFTVAVTDSVGAVATKPLSITVNGPPTFVSGATDSAVFTTTQAATTFYQIQTTGSPSPTLALAPGSLPLPAGVTINSSKNQLTGKPTVSGVFTFTLRATNGSGLTDQVFTLTVVRPPTLGTFTIPTLAIGQPMADILISATGFPAPTFEATGLPAGLTLTNNGDGTATLGGTPTATGTTTGIVITASNAGGSVAKTGISITVNQPVVFTAGPTDGTTFSAVGGTQSYTVLFTPGFPTAFTMTAKLTSGAALPSGLTFVASSTTPSLPAATGTRYFVFKPTSTTPGGVYNIVITATNGGLVTTQAFTLTVLGAPKAITADTNITKFKLNQSVITSVITYNGYSGTGTTLTLDPTTPVLPAGLTLIDNGNGTATISGTPTVTGTFAVKFVATNSFGSFIKSISIKIAV